MIKMKQKIILLFLLIVLLVLTSTIIVAATSEDDAKEIINNFYAYSQSKDVDSYLNLFDVNYLKNIYGEDYKTYISEGISLVDIELYNIDYQYITEDNDGLSLFYNLKATAIIDGSKEKIDNDLVALFSKTPQGLKLKYIILQSNLVEKMNQETILLDSLISAVDENSDLVKQAEQEGIKINPLELKSSSTGISWCWWCLLVLIIFGLIFFKIKSKKHKKSNCLFTLIKSKFNHLLKKTMKESSNLKQNKNVKNSVKYLTKQVQKIKQYRKEKICEIKLRLFIRKTKRWSKKLLKLSKKTYEKEVQPVVEDSVKTIKDFVNKKLKK